MSFNGRAAGICVVLVTIATAAQGQPSGTGAPPSWPTKAVRVIVPSTPGGGADTIGRIFSSSFYESTGQRFVVENRAGAGTMLGTQFAAKSSPDGYTLLIASAALAVNTALVTKNDFDPSKELSPVIWVSSTALMLATHPSVPVKSVRDLIALANARKGKMNGASSGSGTTSHMSVEMFKQLAHIDVTHVPYNGAAPASIAVMSGQVDFIFSNMLTVYPQAQAGRLRALAVTTAKRSAAAPEVPSMADTLPDFESDNWYGFFVPAGTPKEIVARINEEARKALRSSAVLEVMAREGAEPVGSTPEELASKLEREVQRYGKVIKAAGVKPD